MHPLTWHCLFCSHTIMWNNNLCSYNQLSSKLNQVFKTESGVGVLSIVLGSRMSYDVYQPHFSPLWLDSTLKICVKKSAGNAGVSLNDLTKTLAVLTFWKSLLFNWFSFLQVVQKTSHFFAQLFYFIMCWRWWHKHF